MLDLFKSKSTDGDYTIRSLLSELISNLSEIGEEDQAILLSQDTGHHSDIIIQYGDALAVKSLLELFDAILGILDQYNISFDEAGLEDLKYLNDNYYSGDWYFNYIFENYPHILETISTKLPDQSDTKSQIIIALDGFAEALSILASRANLSSFEDYLIEIDDPEAVDEELAYIDIIKQSLNSFVKSKDLFREGNDGGCYSKSCPVCTKHPS